MTSTVSICNVALTRLGESRILTLDDDSKQARALKAVFDSVRDSELRSHLWNFAITRTQLAALATKPSWGFDFEYQLPVDWIRTVQVNDWWPGLSSVGATTWDDSDYKEEDGKILISASFGSTSPSNPTPLKLRYVRRVIDPNRYDALFSDVLAARLSMELCEELTQSNTKMQTMAGVYQKALRDAVRANALEVPPSHLADDTWLAARNV